MKHLIVNTKTGKKRYIDAGNTLPANIIKAKEKQKEYEQVINNLKQSIKTKLINLGFTKNECKYIIH